MQRDDKNLGTLELEFKIERFSSFGLPREKIDPDYRSMFSTPTTQRSFVIARLA
jgi:hypothetical protein